MRRDPYAVRDQDVVCTVAPILLESDDTIDAHNRTQSAALRHANHTLTDTCE
jgi:hypothetical protein